MKTLTKREYYARDAESYIDSENVADCKCQVTIGEVTIYGLSNESDEYMIDVIGDDNPVFAVGYTLNEVLQYFSENY